MRVIRKFAWLGAQVPPELVSLRWRPFVEVADYEEFGSFEVPRAVSAVGMELVTKGYERVPHHHRKAQLILVVRGLVICEVKKGLWMIPSQCALWIPGGMEHGVRCVGDLELYVLFVDPEIALDLPSECSTFSISPLLRELVIAVSRLPQLYDAEGADGRLIQTMLDQLAKAPAERLHVPMPADPRLRKIAAMLTADPSNRFTISEWAREVAMSERSLFRLMLSQTGMSFGRWRRQFQIMFAIERLASGYPVQAVAFDLGYESASAFISMFKKVLGQPPGKYFAERASLSTPTDEGAIA